MDPIVVGAIATAAVGVPLALGLRRWLDGRRRAEMEAFGRPLRMEFAQREEGLERSGLGRLPLFRDGSDPSFLHVLRGRLEGGELLLFDYRHRVGTALTALTHDSLLADAAIGVRKNRAPSYHDMTVVALRRPGERLSSFTVRNGKVIEGAPEARALRCLSGLPGHVHAEAEGEWVAVYRFDRRVPAGELTGFMGRARRFVLEVAGVRPEATGEPPAPLPARGALRLNA